MKAFVALSETIFRTHEISLRLYGEFWIDYCPCASQTLAFPPSRQFSRSSSGRRTKGKEWDAWLRQVWAGQRAVIAVLQHGLKSVIPVIAAGIQQRRVGGAKTLHRFIEFFFTA